MTVREAQTRAVGVLMEAAKTGKADFTSPALDSAVLLAHFMGTTRSHLMAHPESDIGGAESRFFAAIERRARGLPVSYLTGLREFWGLEFLVNEDVLIPKPDTETLVERAVAILDGVQSGNHVPVSVIDVCTGSGCIAVALKRDFPDMDMTATDISVEALEVARNNASRLLGDPHGNVPIRFVQGDLRAGLPPPASRVSPPDGYDLIVSNPPYVPTDVARGLLEDGRGEPLLALDGGVDGLDLVRALIDEGIDALIPGGRILIETGEYNARAAADHLSLRGFVDIVIHRDLAGLDRVIEGKRHE